MPDIKDLYDVLTSPENANKYFTETPSFEDFQKKLQNESYQSKVHGIVLNDLQVYSGGINTFKNQFTPNAPVEVNIPSKEIFDSKFLTKEKPPETYVDNDNVNWSLEKGLQGDFWYSDGKIGSPEKQKEINQTIFDQAKLVPNKDFFGQDSENASNELKALLGEAFKIKDLGHISVYDMKDEKTGVPIWQDPNNPLNQFRGIRGVQGIEISTIDGKNKAIIPFNVFDENVDLRNLTDALVQGEHSQHFGKIMTLEEAKNTEIYKQTAEKVGRFSNNSYKILNDFLENNSTNESNLALAKQQKKVRNVTELYNEYSNSKYNLKEIESQLLDPNDEKYNKDLFKRTLKYITKTGTGVYDEPYREELEEARKLLRQEEQYTFTGEFEPLVPETPGINISIPKITEIPQELVEQKAREIIVENERLKIKENTITDFLNDLEDGDVLPLSLQAFKDNPELLQKVLTQGQENFSKEYALKTEMYLEEKSVFDSDEFKNFEDLSKKLSDPNHKFTTVEGEPMVILTDSRKQVPKRIIDKYNSDRAKFGPKVEKVVSLQNDIVDNIQDIEDVGLQLDLLKRSYNGWENFLKGTSLSFKELVVNIGGFTDDVKLVTIPTPIGIKQVPIFTHNVERHNAWVEKKRAIDKERQKMEKPIDFDNAFDSWKNFGKFSTTELQNQLPIFATLAVPYVGWGTLLTSSFGEQYANMTAKEIATGVDYNMYKQAITSLGYAIPELAFELVTTIPLLKGAGYALRGAFGGGIKNMTLQGVREGVKDGLPYFLKGTALGSLGEGGTTLTQNIVTGRTWYEDVDHALFSGLMFESTIAAVPIVTGTTLNLLSDKKSTQEFRDNLSKIDNLNERNEKLQKEIKFEEEFGNKKLASDLKLELEQNNKIIKELSKQNETNLANRKRTIVGQWLGIGKNNKQGMNAGQWNQFFKAKTEQERIRTEASKVRKNKTMSKSDQALRLGLLKKAFDANQSFIDRAKGQNMAEFWSWAANSENQGELQSYKDLATEFLRKGNLKRGASTIEPDDEAVLEQARILWNKDKIYKDVLNPGKKSKLLNELEVFDTQEQAIEAVENMGAAGVLSLKQVKEITSTIKEGGHGFDGPNKKSYIVVDNMAKDDRLEIKTHELFHRVTSEAIKRNPGAFKELADMVLDWAEQNDKKTYNTLLNAVERDSKGNLKNDEVLAVFLEEVAGNRVKYKTDGSFIGPLTWLLGKKIKENHGIDMDLAGEPDAIKMLIGLGKKIKKGDISLKEIQEELSQTEIIKKAKKQTKELKGKDKTSYSKVYQDVEAMYSDEIWNDPERKKEVALKMAYALIPETIRRMRNINLDDETKLDIATDFVLAKDGLFGAIMLYDRSKNDSIMAYLNSIMPQSGRSLFDTKLIKFYKNDPKYGNIVQSIEEESVGRKVQKQTVEDDTDLDTTLEEGGKTKINILKINKVASKEQRIIKAIKDIGNFKNVIENNVEKVANILFGIPGQKIVDPKKNITTSNEILDIETGQPLTQKELDAGKKGILSYSEALTIQNFFTDIGTVKDFIRAVLTPYNIAESDADINRVGENRKVSRDTLGTAIGLPRRILDYFYEPYTDPKALSKDPKVKKQAITSPKGRSKGLTSQTDVYRLKPEFRNLSADKLTKAAKKFQQDLGITAKKQVNKLPTKEDRSKIGQLLKGAAKVMAVQASLSAAQRSKEIKTKQAEKVGDKAKVEKLKQETADITAAQNTDIAYSKASNIDIINFINSERNVKAEYYSMNEGTMQERMAAADRYVEDVVNKLVPIFENYPGLVGRSMLVSDNLFGITKNNKTYKPVKYYVQEQIKKRAPLFSQRSKNNQYSRLKFSTDLLNKSTDQELIDLGNKNVANFTLMWNLLYKALQNDPMLIEPLVHFFEVSQNEGTHLNRLGAPLIAIDKTVKKWHFEHALQNVATYELLLKAAATESESDFKNTLKTLKENYKLIAVSNASNKLLDKAGYKDAMSLDGSWNIFDNRWIERYFNQDIASLGGINPNNLRMVGSQQSIADAFNINEEGGPKYSKANVFKGVILGDAVKMSRSAFDKFQAQKQKGKEFVKSIKPQLKQSRGITVLDFDDTLATTKSLVRFTAPDGTTGTLNAEQYASNYQNLLKLGYKFDFSEFNKVVGGKLAPLFNKAIKLQGKFGPENMFVLTARPPAAQKAIFDFLKANGLNIPLKNITGLGNSTAEAKALWIADKVGEGYNDFYFADDALQNVQAVDNMLEQFDVKRKVQQAKVKFSKSMDIDFNKILEEAKGVDAKKRFSAAKAAKRGAKKGKFNIFIPPSADDFNGLLYYFLGKGRQGEKHMEFFKKALISPLNRAYRELNDARQSIASEYKELKKLQPKAYKKLNKKTPDGDFTYSDAVRVYLWDKHGFDIPGLSKTDQKNLSDLVKKDPELLSFADALGIMTKQKEGYVPAGENWLVEDIRNDLDTATNKIGRKQFFQEFIDNAEIIFSKENLNKIEAIYGSNFREALEDILYRTINGTNRNFGKNRLVNNFMNWINGSIGATMFINARSAVLQTISMVNFINWSDNNFFKAAKAFANQPQFWKDFSMIFNSNMLKQRRSGLKTDINAAELAGYVSKSKEPFKAAVSWLLSKGFLPTQIADSFAIAMGGASFYRNRIKTYIEQGYTKAEAEQKAFDDFAEIAEETQQSARPDKISQQQASPLGRLILAFQNTPMQYMRLTKKAALDLVNRRGDVKTNISKIIYYVAVQNLIFGALQSALFAIAFGDDDDKDDEFFKKKKDRVINGSIDTILRGMGIGGAVVATLKNVVRKFREEQEKPKWKQDEYAELLEALQISPPIGIKARKLVQAKRTYVWDQDVMKEMSILDIDNPIWDAVGNTVEATTNIPLARLHNKVDNIREALNTEHEAWQRVALGLGWSSWNLGIDGIGVKKIDVIKDEIKRKKKLEKKLKNKKKKKTKFKYYNY